jgi:geranylgeranyl diphosphate synthase type I
VPVAAAVEVQMVALDLLDDVEDGESNPLLETYGLPATVNVATGLIYLAQRMLLELADGAALAAILADAGLSAAAGQHADLTVAADVCLALDTAMAITGSKSGTLMAAACRLGAAVAGADAAQQRLFARFGFLGGVVAQLANDITALAPEAVGKTDRTLHRPTLPLVYAARSRMPAAKSDHPLLGREDGAGHFAWAVADVYRRHALSLIPTLSGEPASHADLADLLRVL